jgi:LysM domain-containing protein
MTAPGEVLHSVGLAYQCVFIGALEANIRYFENKFSVHTEPEKTTFRSRTGKSYSFDFNGVYNHPWNRAEVFGECKGYSKASNLLSEYKSFLAKAYVTSLDYERHSNDYFWFVTNVPFACSEGSAIWAFQFMAEALRDSANTQIHEILGEGHIDDDLVRSLVSRIGVFILTDSFLMNTNISYKVATGDSLWTILKKFHAGKAPRSFGLVARQIMDENRLKSPDFIVAGRRIRVPWGGIGRQA